MDNDLLLDYRTKMLMININKLQKSAVFISYSFPSIHLIVSYCKLYDHSVHSLNSFVMSGNSAIIICPKKKAARINIEGNSLLLNIK